MYTYRDQLEILKPIKLAEGETKRVDCPFCGGRKTFTISRHEGNRVWNCYRASCGVRGGTSDEMSRDTIRRRLENGPTRRTVRNTIPIPQHLSDPRHHDRAMKYLKSMHSLYAFENGMIDIRYAPAEDRVLFFTNNGEGAVGRSIRGDKPKWKAYGDISGLLSAGLGDTAVVVEDAASACAVARSGAFTGCALLGTNLSPLQKHQLRAYSKVLIALDADATRKAVKMKSSLEGLIVTKVVMLPTDIKYMSQAEMEETLS